MGKSIKLLLLKSEIQNMQICYFINQEIATFMGKSIEKLLLKNGSVTFVGKYKMVTTLVITFKIHDLVVGHWIPNPGVQVSKALGGSLVGSTFHPSEVDKTKTSNSQTLTG